MERNNAPVFMKNIIRGTEDELNDEQMALLKQFRTKVEDLPDTKNDHYLLRWLIARKFDIEKAEDMLRKHVKLWKDLDVTNIAPNFVPSEVMKDVSYTRIGLDKAGNTVFVLLLEYIDLKGLANSTPVFDQAMTGACIIQSAVNAMNEIYSETLSTGRKLVLIADMHGIRLPRNMFVIRQNLKLIQLLESNYPEILEKVFILNASTLFYAWFNLVKMAIESRTLSRINFYQNGEGINDMLEIIDENVLPAFLGGKRTDPSGDPMCDSLFSRVRKMPKNRYYSHQSPSRTLWHSDALDVTIPRRSYHNYALRITEAESRIHWIVRTRAYNIGFGIYYAGGCDSISWDRDVDEIKGDVNNWITPLEIVDSSPTPMEWQVFCERTGTYICHFDNTYSWLTSKQVGYVIQVFPPGVSARS